MVIMKSINQNAHICRVRKIESTLVSSQVATRLYERRRRTTPKRTGAISAVPIVILHNLEISGGHIHIIVSFLGKIDVPRNEAHNLDTLIICLRRRYEGGEMSKDRDRMIYRRPDKKWANKRNDSNKASSLHNTQKEAEKAAREMLENQGGGELTTKGLDGKIRSKDTIAPGNDPFPPRDTEH